MLKRERKRRAEAIELYGGRAAWTSPTRSATRGGAPQGLHARGLSDAELEALVDEAVAATDAITPKDMGKVMGWLKPKVAGRADGKKLSDLVRGRLGG